MMGLSKGNYLKDIMDIHRPTTDSAQGGMIKNEPLIYSAIPCKLIHTSSTFLSALIGRTSIGSYKIIAPKKFFNEKYEEIRPKIKIGDVCVVGEMGYRIWNVFVRQSYIQLDVEDGYAI
jgi:hypothetical protein